MLGSWAGPGLPTAEGAQGLRLVQGADEAELLLLLNISQSSLLALSGLSLSSPFACIFHLSMLKPSLLLPGNPQNHRVTG